MSKALPYPHEYQNNWGPVVWVDTFKGLTHYWYECRECTRSSRVKRMSGFCASLMAEEYCQIPRAVYLSARCLTEMCALKCPHIDWEALAQCGD
jgi:hypothetical protein